MAGSLAVLLVPALLGLGSCATGASSRGAEQAPPEPAAQAAPAEARPLTLWQVSRDGGPPSWLFGTCHLGVALDEALPVEQHALLAGAAKFVMEVDPATMDPVTMQERLRLPEGQSLSALLGEELWPQLIEEFSLGPAAQSFDGMHPFALVGYVLSLMANELSGTSTLVPMDFALSEMAASQGVAQDFLETLDEQLDIFLGMPMEKFIEALRDLTRPEKRAEMKSDLAAVLAVCRTGDDSGLAALREKSGDDDWEQRLLIRRNHLWVPKLEGFFAEGSTFVAAGAGHMFGDEGLVELLRGRGHTVVRLEGVTGGATSSAGPGAGAAPAATGPSAESLPLSFLLGQVESMAVPTLCAEEMVPVQCHGVTSERCRAVLTEAVLSCAMELELPAELPQELVMSSIPALGECIVPRFQELLPPEQKVVTEECKAAHETLQ